MYKHCTTEESAQRQRQLEQCLLKLMLDMPYSGITISHICQQAGISRKSFYRYFVSKESCLHALIDHVIMDGSTYFITKSDSGYTDLAFCTRIFEYWRQQAPLLDALCKNNLTLQLPQRMMRYMLDEEPEYAHYMGISPTDAVEHVVYMVSGTMGLVLAWHHEHFEKTAAQMGSILYQLIKRQSDKGDD